MRLITRCPRCATMFKIVPDQLRLSEGWVRCGHCGEVFDGFSHLQARAMPPAPAAAPAQEPPASAPVPEPRSSAPEEHAPPGWDETVMPLEAESRWFEDSAFGADALSPEELKIVQGHLQRTRQSRAPAEPEEAADTPDDATGAEPPREEEPDGPEAAFAARSGPAQPRHGSGRAKAEGPPDPFGDLRPDPTDAVDDAEPATAEEVSFVRAARRKAFWRRPLVRALLAVLTLALLALLGLQAVVHERDRLAAVEPRLVPWLEQLCEPLQCRLAPLRQIDSVAIDSSSFNKADGEVFRLAFTLRNSATVAVAMPAIELTLTDTQDQPLVRRVLQPAELGAPAALPARSDWSATVALTLEGNSLSGRIAGYRLAVFYP